MTCVAPKIPPVRRCPDPRVQPVMQLAAVLAVLPIQVHEQQVPSQRLRARWHAAVDRAVRAHQVELVRQAAAACARQLCLLAQRHGLLIHRHVAQQRPALRPERQKYRRAPSIASAGVAAAAVLRRFVAAARLHRLRSRGHVPALAATLQRAAVPAVVVGRYIPARPCRQAYVGPVNVDDVAPCGRGLEAAPGLVELLGCSWGIITLLSLPLRLEPRHPLLQRPRVFPCLPRLARLLPHRRLQPPQPSHQQGRVGGRRRRRRCCRARGSGRRQRRDKDDKCRDHTPCGAAPTRHRPPCRTAAPPRCATSCCPERGEWQRHLLLCLGIPGPVAVLAACPNSGRFTIHVPAAGSGSPEPLRRGSGESERRPELAQKQFIKEGV
eukprot:SAG25_NODE_66_length_17563_cov_34.737918_9_plen_381_part_00